MLPLPAQHTAPATTSEQFAAATRNRALYLLAESMREATRSYVVADDPHPSDLRCYAQPGALVLERWREALDRCMAELVRADTYAPDGPADELALRRLRRWRQARPVPAWRSGDL